MSSQKVFIYLSIYFQKKCVWSNKICLNYRGKPIATIVIQMGFIIPRKLSWFCGQQNCRREDWQCYTHVMEQRSAIFSPLSLFVNWQFHLRKTVANVHQCKRSSTKFFFCFPCVEMEQGNKILSPQNKILSPIFTHTAVIIQPAKQTHGLNS